MSCGINKTRRNRSDYSSVLCLCRGLVGGNYRRKWRISYVIDRIELLETTLSHLIPEMTANVLVLAFILIYMFILGWRVALLSLSILPVGFVLILFTFRDYSENFQ